MNALTEQDLVELLRAQLSIDFTTRQMWRGDGEGWQSQRVVRIWLGAELITEADMC